VAARWACSSEVRGLVDVNEQAVERNVADGLLEEDVDERRRADAAQRTQHQQQLAEASRLRRVVGVRVSTQRHLSLVLQTRHRRRVTQLAYLVTTAAAATAALQRYTHTTHTQLEKRKKKFEIKYIDDCDMSIQQFDVALCQLM